MNKTKAAAMKAARQALGPEAIEGVDFQLRNTGAGWDHETIPPANEAAEKAQDERLAAAPKAKRAKAAKKGPPKESREERRRRLISEADARNAAPKEPRSAKPREPKAAPASDVKPAGENKTEVLVRMMSRAAGATSKDMETATGWQPHSVRGLIGTLKSKKGYNIVSSKEKGQPTVYRIPPEAKAAPAEVGDIV